MYFVKRSLLNNWLIQKNSVKQQQQSLRRRAPTGEGSGDGGQKSEGGEAVAASALWTCATPSTVSWPLLWPRLWWWWSSAHLCTHFRKQAAGWKEITYDLSWKIDKKLAAVIRAYQEKIFANIAQWNFFSTNGIEKPWWYGQLQAANKHYSQLSLIKTRKFAQGRT